LHSLFRNGGEKFDLSLLIINR